jgi:hypothetical protein
MFNKKDLTLISVTVTQEGLKNLLAGFKIKQGKPIE